MLEGVTVLDRLADVFQTTGQRILVTAAMAALVFAVVLASRKLSVVLTDRLKPLHVDVLSTGLLVASFVTAVSVSLGVWDQTSTLVDAYAELGLGPEAIPRLITTFVVLVSAYIVTRFVHRLLHELFDSSAAVTEHQREITHRLSQVVIWTVAIIVVLGVWEVNLSGLLLGAGFLGIVIGMAARQTLGALLAGFVLMFARPFEIGDWIEVDGQEGIVTDISIVNTRILTFDGEYVMIPNDVVTSSVVANRSKKGRIRIEIDVNVDYSTDVERAAELAEEAVEDVREAMSVPSPQTVTKELGESSVVLGVRFWIDKPSARRKWNARTAAIGAIKETFEAEGIKIPFPQRELSGRAETDGFRVAHSEGSGETEARTRASDGTSSVEPDRERETEPTPEDD